MLTNTRNRVHSFSVNAEQLTYVHTLHEQQLEYARQDRQNTYNLITPNFDIQKYNNEITLQIDEYRERNNSSPSYLKINKRALQILYYYQISYLHRADVGAAIINEYAGLKVCPTDDIDIDCVEVF